MRIGKLRGSPMQDVDRLEPTTSVQRERLRRYVIEQVWPGFERGDHSVGWAKCMPFTLGAVTGVSPRTAWSWMRRDFPSVAAWLTYGQGWREELVPSETGADEVHE